MTDIVRIGAIAVVTALCAVVVKQKTPELAMALSLLGGAILLSYALGGMETVRRTMDELAATAGLSLAVLAPLMKTVGIAILTKLAAELCRDAKESGLASFVETAGAVAALCVALPLFRAVLGMVTGLLT